MLNAIEGTTIYKGKKYSVTLATDGGHEGLFVYDAYNGVYKQLVGTCDFHDYEDNRKLKKAIRNTLIDNIYFDTDFDTDEKIKIRVHYESTR